MSDLTTRLPTGSEAQCTTCRRFFTSDNGFDGHLRGLKVGGCEDPGEMFNKFDRPLYEVVQHVNGETWRSIKYDRDGNRLEHPRSPK